VRMRAFVNETDIGNVQAGQMATVTVDAFPNRRFVGVVEKVEPQAVVQSSVTMFPVLVSLNNSDNALKPGMNGQVVMDIVRKDNVLAVPSDAIRNARDAATVAPVLGVSQDSLRSMMASMRQNRGRGRGGAASSTASSTGRDTTGRRFGGDSTGRRFGGNFARGAASGTASSTRGGFNRQGGAPGAGGAGGAGAFAGGGGGGPMIVFVKKGEKYTPHVVRVGISDFDYTEILSGLQEGDEVALLGAAVLQAQRDELQQRIRSRAGGGLQQQQQNQGGGGGGGGGGRGGG
ncbi:MAG TPA: efflux RND transporter periplasmic adaptor subunit, partial [Gemmatimonadaceae bacterium]|nr:efflux RND transporter periplasmic adaptor subunit [Gemmatimonadaceae bacterium]